VFSFSARKQRVEIAPYLRRICDCSTPNSGRIERLERIENRYNRTLPVLFWPWENDRVLADEGATAVTKDLTDQGIALILNGPIAQREIVVCLLSDDSDVVEPWFFLGQVLRCEEIGAGFRLIGVELSDFLNRNRPESVEVLRPQTERLRPSSILC